jgi:thiamine pyrophosphate-dependent acetolactate synthase large subunit-like protein
MISTNVGQVRPGADPPAADGGAQTVSDVIVDVLANAGVRRIYGVTGDALNAFVEALRKDGRIEWVAVRHEESAAFAAYAEAEINGGIGVCAGTVGPGALHLLNGLYNAKREGTGVVAITGQVARELRGRSYFQEVDLGKVFDDVCGMQVAIEDPAQLPLTAEMAVRHALRKREVVRIELPVDVTTLRASGRSPVQRLAADVPPPAPDGQAIAAAAAVLDAAERVTVLAGAGCRGAADDVLALAEHLGAPVVHTLKARDIFDFHDGRVVGLTGLIGMPAGYHAVKDCDALLMLGTDFPYEEFYPDHARVVQVDVRPEHIGRRVAVDAAVVGDAGAAARALREQVRPQEPGRWLRRHEKLRDRWLRRDERHVEPDAGHPLDPRLVTRAVVDRAAVDAIFTMDTGSCAIWIGHEGTLAGGRRLIGSFNHGSMGAAVPAALGAACAAPGREVWALVGDGGFVMSSQDLATIAHLRLPVRVVLFNNRQLAFVKMEMEAAGIPYNPASIDLHNPDFVTLARASGWNADSIERPEDVERVLNAATVADGPFLIDAVVSPGVLSMPPHLTAGQAWGFGMSKLREAAIFAREGDHEQWRNWRDEIEAAL